MTTLQRHPPAPLASLAAATYLLLATIVLLVTVAALIVRTLPARLHGRSAVRPSQGSVGLLAGPP